MWVKRALLLSLLLGVLVSGTAWAGNNNKELEKVRSSLSLLMPELRVDAISPSPVPGLYEVMLGPQVIYVTGDGRYLIQGSIIDLELRKNITEPRLESAKARTIEQIGVDNMVVFGHKHPKHIVTVFTDIDSGYSRKMHSEMAKYSEHGIQVRYLFFPRSGIGSTSYHKAVSVWCADNRKQAMNMAKRGKTLEQRQCRNPVQKHMMLGKLMGVVTTPSIVTSDGELLPGYVTAEKLSDMLNQKRKRRNR